MCRGPAWPELAAGKDARRTCFDGGCAACLSSRRAPVPLIAAPAQRVRHRSSGVRHPPSSSPRRAAQGTLGDSMKLSLYRKYRPQTFDEVVGQDHVSRTLQNAVRTRCGRPRLRLRRAARHRQDEHGQDPRQGAQLHRARRRGHPVTGPTVTPCGICESCRAIAASTALDVIEMDAASNRGIDDIRELRDKVGFAPVHGPLEGLHHRRSPHAHQGGLQRPAQDARGAAAARRLRARHDRGAQDPGDHPVALPALRLPPPARAGDRPGARPHRRHRAHRHRRRRGARDRRHAEGGFRDAIGMLDKLATFFGETRISSREVLDVLGVIDDGAAVRARRHRHRPRRRPGRCCSCSGCPSAAPTTPSSSTTCCPTCARSSSCST